MWQSEGGVATLCERRMQLSHTKSGIQHLLRVTATVPNVNAQRRKQALQELCERQRKQRTDALNSSRHLSPSDVSDDVITEDEVMNDDPDPVEFIDETGELGGVICPVCFSHWYTILDAEKSIICNGCRVPLQYSGPLSALRTYIRDITKDHDQNCTSYLVFEHFVENDGHNLLCACTQCDYLHALL